MALFEISKSPIFMCMENKLSFLCPGERNFPPVYTLRYKTLLLLTYLHNKVIMHLFVSVYNFPT